MEGKERRRRPSAPQGKDLVKEALEHQELVRGTEEGYRELDEGRAVVVRWEDVKGKLGNV